MKFLKLKMLNLLENAGIGVASTFIPLYANILTNSYIMIGIIVSSYALAQSLSYTYFGRVSDRLANRVLFIRLGFLFSAISFYAQILAFDGISLLIIRIIAGVSTGIYTGALIARYYEGGRDNVKLASIISFGSLGWLIGILGGGVLENIFDSNIKIIFLLSGSSFLVGFLISLRIRDNPKGEVRRLLPIISSIKNNKIIYTTFLIRHVGASAVWSIFPIFLSRIGADTLWISIIYSINALTQFVFMNRASILQNYSIAIKLGTILSSIVFLSYFLIEHYILILPIQILLGVSWSLLYVGSLNYLLIKNQEKATVTSLLESTISVSAIIGPLIGGLLAELFEMKTVIFFAFIINSISIGLASMLKITSKKNV
ncbi:MAG: MFS transporter [Candidatus Nitrosocaldaceae archaeon]